ncbi:MAG: sigma-70 family RNA polymerase sigma factor, partial [Actinomycetota bacterium]|nr:sigma-70 family RNA polymerase sigma factor [Actinomycetota bacterium]
LRHRGVVSRHAARETEPSPLPGADEPALDAHRRNAVLDALRTLPRRQREVLTLRYYLDLSEAEIADTLGISRGSVKAHASRGSAALRDLLDGAEL